MIPAPTHDEIIAMWSRVARIEGGEPACLIFPSLRTPVAGMAFYPAAGVPVAQTVLGLLERLRTSEVIPTPCRWLAMAVPGYTSSSEGDDLPVPGELEDRYLSGDDAVREGVTTIVLTNEEGDQPRMRTYIQPLLEPDGDGGVAEPEGPLAGAIILGLMSANLGPEIG
jgi:hypothetical protein